MRSPAGVYQLKQAIRDELDKIRSDGLEKAERVIVSPQGPGIRIKDGTAGYQPLREQLSGPGRRPARPRRPLGRLEGYGFGLASVRFICGTQTVHKELEQRSQFLGTEDTILYASCSTPTAGFRDAPGEQDAVISDALNHASIIDGVRLCKAKRFRYNNNDMADLEAQLKAARCAAPDHRHRRRVLHGRLSSRRWARSVTWRSTTTRW